MQKQIENDGDEYEYDKAVDSPYVGNKDITMALKNLKTELHQARLDTAQTINEGKGIDETIEAKQVETSGNTDEIIVSEHQEKEQSMDC